MSAPGSAWGIGTGSWPALSLGGKGRFVVRFHPMPPSPTILQDLRHVYQSGSLIVFAGAGVSAAAGLPTWRDIAQQLRDRLHDEGSAPDVIAEMDDLIRRRQLIDALSAARHRLGDNEFYVAIENAVNDTDVAIPDVAAAIAELEPKLRAIVTTNLDRILERAFSGNWEEFAAPTGDIVQRTRYILKLHGTRTDRRTWIFTRDQYDQATFGRPLQRRTLEALFSAHPILFVGYGLADDDFDGLLAAARALSGEQPPMHFALLQGPIPPYRRKKLEAAGLRLVEYDAHADVPGIVRSLP
jgi:hypothetical protein